MKRTFTALRFIEDENISDRTYWYECGFAVEAGALVLAPVGTHDRLQCARVERVTEADEKNAPYDVRLIKRVEAECGARKLVVGRMTCFELGGLKYDTKRYTRFRRVLFSEFSEDLNEEEKTDLRDYGVTRIMDMPASMEEIARAKGCVLVKGKGAKHTAEALLAAVRGEEKLPVETVKYLQEKLR